MKASLGRTREYLTAYLATAMNSASLQIKTWSKNGLLSYLLFPISILYLLCHCVKYWFLSNKKKIPAKVICIGNVTVGGSGKTPLAISIAKFLQEENKKVAFISRGYKGKLSSSHPLKVESYHTADDVGDEPLLLAQVAPVYICTNRYLAGMAAAAAGAEIVIMDDGLQNNSIEKDLTILVVDGEYGLGNGFILPSGPLREPLSWAVKRTDVVFCYKSIPRELVKCEKAIIGKLVASENQLQGANCIAFCGIGMPQKFFKLLKESGVNVVESYSFPDHHCFSYNEISNIVSFAQANDLKIVTTAKDWVRLPKEIDKKYFHIFKVETLIPDALKTRIRDTLSYRTKL